MKVSKMLVLGTLVLALCMAGSTFAASCDLVVLADGLGPTGLTHQVGDTIEYTITMQVPAIDGIDVCTLTDVSIWFYPPPAGAYPGTGCDFAVDPVLIDSGLTLAPGDPLIVYTSLDNAALTYVVQASDAGTEIHAEMAVTFFIEGSGDQQCDEKAAHNSVECPEPCVTITKELVPDSPTVSKVGDEVNYRICITNCGIFDLTNVEVTDPLLGVGLLAGFPSTLTPGEQVCVDFPYTVQVGDPDPLTNTATVTGIDACDGVTEATDSATFELNLFQPSITITKECDSVAEIGDTVNYTITVENTSSADTPNLVGSVTDTLLGPLGPVDLAPGGVAVFTPTRVVLDTDPDPLENTATVTVSPVGFPNVLEASDTCSTDILNPDFTVTKVCVTEPLSPGNDAEFEITITNTGEVDLIIMTDEAGLPGPVDLLQGQTILLNVLIPVVDTDVFNEINVIATAPGGATIEKSASDTCSVVLNPDLTVTKVCVTEPLSPGDDAEFLITITNTGDVDLIIDTDESAIGVDVPLPAGGVIVQSVFITAGDTDVSNTINVSATVPGHPEIDPIVLSASDTCTVEVPGGEGCTPGFWKNNADKHGASAWCDAYDPDDSFEAVFGVDVTLRGQGKTTYTSPTLLQALDANGGGINALARHAVAALLNACSGCVEYATDNPQDIIDAVQDAVAAGPGAIQDLHELLAYYNEAGCPVNQHGECSHPI